MGKILLYSAEQAEKDMEQHWEKIKDLKGADRMMGDFQAEVLLTLSKIGEPIR